MAEAAFDLLISGGRVVDGTGSPWRRADIGIRDGRIAAMGVLEGGSSRRIDAGDRLVMPGFVDVHAHSDFALTIHPEAESQVGQGITTEVIGNCGFSAYPRLPETLRLLFDPPGVEGDWSSPADYFKALGRRLLGDNVVSLVGHSTIRQAVVGGEQRAPTAAELGKMSGLLRDALKSGAAGMSTGLDYVPGIYADVDELVELSKVIAEFGGVYASHLRGYTDTLEAAVAEAIEIGERSGCAIQLSHMDVFGRPNWGRSTPVVEMVRAARARGVDVTADMMSYPTAGAWWAPRAIFPEDVYAWRLPARQAVPSLVDQLRDPSRRAELRSIVEARRVQPKKGFHEELLIFSTWADIYLDDVSAGSANAPFIGLSLDALAAERGVEPVDAYFDLLLSEGPDLSTTHIAISEDDYVTFCQQPWMMFGTDSIATSPEFSGEPFNTIQAHPRHYANFIRVLTNHVRDRGWLTLEDAVRKMTSLPARRFGLFDRGVLAPGMAADIAVVDLGAAAEVATWLDPRRKPTGLDFLLVNGVPTLEDGVFTETHGGRPLLMKAGAAA